MRSPLTSHGLNNTVHISSIHFSFNFPRSFCFSLSNFSKSQIGANTGTFRNFTLFLSFFLELVQVLSWVWTRFPPFFQRKKNQMIFEKLAFEVAIKCSLMWRFQKRSNGLCNYVGLFVIILRSIIIKIS